MTVTLFDLLYLAGALLTTLVCLVVILYRGSQRPHNRFLAIGLFSQGYLLFSFFLIETRLLAQVPHLYRTGSLMGFVFWPAMYLYVQRSVSPAPLRWRDALHLLPLLLFLIDFTPFFLSSAEEKRYLYLSKAYAQYIIGLNEGWLVPTWGYLLLRLGQIGLYLSLQVALVWRWYRRTPRPVPAETRVWLRWFVLLLAVQGVLALSASVITSGHALDAYRAWFMGAIGVMALATTLALLLRPQILYGLHGPVPSGLLKPVPRPAPSREVPDRDLHDQLTKLMREEQPFLKSGYSLPDLANGLGVPVHQLSHYINHRYGINFNEYINQYRIEYFKTRVRGEGWRRMTLEALAQESGFSNRFTFTNAFKRLTGTTPSEYLRTRREAS
jgi:AraC-like DNA-binding protein